MKVDKSLIVETIKIILARYPRFGADIAKTKIEYNKNLPYHTAATDGEKIYIDPNYFESLTEDERLFLIAHEIMHNKFEHMYRLKTSSGEIKDFHLWNIATDAIINANLERDGFKIKQGYVNIPNALEYSAEELYEKLLKEKEEKQKQNNKNGEQSDCNSQSQDGTGNSNNNENSENSSQKGDNSPSNKDDINSGAKDLNESNSNSEGVSETNSKNESSEYKFIDDHSIWEEAFKKMEEEQKNVESSKQNKNASQNNQKAEDESEKIDFSPVDEKSEFEQNREKRREIARANFERMKNEGLQSSGQNIDLGDVGEAKPILDWKLLLRREVGKTETIWSQRRSIAENNYAYRLEENDVEDEAVTEVMIDVSGSVSINMVKAFLRQLKSLIKESKLKVGCFNERFWGMKEIKSVRDIDNFTIPEEARGHSAWTEDWDLAVRSFTKKREINKIVFTDGEPCPGTMPKEDLKGTNVIWIVYRNRDFNPCCGKVIQITPNQLKQLNAVKSDDLCK